jgi:hypothetical protein
MTTFTIEEPDFSNPCSEKQSSQSTTTNTPPNPAKKAKKINNKNKNDTREKIRVLYHFPCPDGAFSALATYLYYKDDKKYGKKKND